MLTKLGLAYGIVLSNPNLPQDIPLAWVEQNEDNVRLFVERESLTALRDIYRAWDRDPSVVLPDSPIVRFVGYREDGTPRLVLLAGERRLTAARLEALAFLPMRVVQMLDEQAYRFILDHNKVEGITTVELAFRATEMERLDFSFDEIRAAIGEVSVHRYTTVGALVYPEDFSDEPKRCDPSIVEWYEAALFGYDHFRHCFNHWNAGAWDAKQCSREFRKRGKALPIDNAEKGFRITLDENRLVLRGQVDLDITDGETACDMISEVRHLLIDAIHILRDMGHFGERQVVHVNQDTIYNTLS